MNNAPENITVVELTGKESNDFKRVMGGSDFTHSDPENITVVELTGKEDDNFKQLMSGINNINRDINERQQSYETMINNTHKIYTNEQLIDKIQKELTTLSNLFTILATNLSNTNKLSRSEDIPESYTGKGLLSKAEINQLEQQLKENMRKLIDRSKDIKQLASKFNKTFKTLSEEKKTSASEETISHPNPENITVVELTGKESEDFKKIMGGSDFTYSNPESTNEIHDEFKLVGNWTN